MLSGRSELMQSLAGWCHGKVSSIRLYDANVCSWTHPPGRPWEITPVSGEPFLEELRCRSGSHQLTIHANSIFLRVSRKGIFPYEVLSVNQPDLNGLPLKEVVDQHTDLFALFTRSGRLSHQQQKLVNSRKLMGLVTKLGLQPDEILSVVPNEVSAYLRTPSLSRATSSLEALAGFGDEIENSADAFDFADLPQLFRPLVPLIQKWGIEDDSDRMDFLANLTASDLTQLVAEVRPYLKSIDSYLDSFKGEALPEGARLLGRLAECTLEAERLLSNENH